MIKLVCCVARKPDVSPETFRTYWREQHGPKVRERQGAIRATRYVQSHTVEPELNDLLQQSRGLEPPYAGITELWWDSVADLKAALSTPEGVKAMQELKDDESTFIDFAHSRVFMTEEHTVF